MLTGATLAGNDTTRTAAETVDAAPVAALTAAPRLPAVDAPPAGPRFRPVLSPATTGAVARAVAVAAALADPDKMTSAQWRAVTKSGGNVDRDTIMVSAAKPPKGAAFLRWPTSQISPSSPFGMRHHPILGYSRLHTGTDFAPACNTRVSAAADGSVTFVGVAGGYGNRVVISHGKRGGHTYETTYSHLAGTAVKPGQKVKQGQAVGAVGNTGLSTGCHLHFEVLRDDLFVDPMPYLTGKPSTSDLTGVTVTHNSRPAPSKPTYANTRSVWDKVAQCESSGNWSINTGNGFYGGLQFTKTTWLEFGGGRYAPYAHLATPQQQVAIAKKVLAGQGPGAWPVCSIKAGLTATNGQSGSTKAAPKSTAQPKPTPKPTPAPKSTAQPKPTPKPTPAPKSTAQPTPAPKPKPTPKPTPSTSTSTTPPAPTEPSTVTSTPEPTITQPNTSTSEPTETEAGTAKPVTATP